MATGRKIRSLSPRKHVPLTPAPLVRAIEKQGGFRGIGSDRQPQPLQQQQVVRDDHHPAVLLAKRKAKLQEIAAPPPTTSLKRATSLGDSSGAAMDVVRYGVLNGNVLPPPKLKQNASWGDADLNQKEEDKKKIILQYKSCKQQNQMENLKTNSERQQQQRFSSPHRRHSSASPQQKEKRPSSPTSPRAAALLRVSYEGLLSTFWKDAISNDSSTTDYSRNNNFDADKDELSSMLQKEKELLQQRRSTFTSRGGGGGDNDALRILQRKSHVGGGDHRHKNSTTYKNYDGIMKELKVVDSKNRLFLGHKQNVSNLL